MRCHFTVYRFDPKSDKKPRYQEYGVDAESTDKILDWFKQNQMGTGSDPGLPLFLCPRDLWLGMP